MKPVRSARKIWLWNQARDFAGEPILFCYLHFSKKSSYICTVNGTNA